MRNALWISGLTLGLALLAPACTIRGGLMTDASPMPVVYDNDAVIAYTRAPPPPPPEEAVPPSPGVGYAWVAGAWRWTPSGRWEWQGGRWVPAPRGSVWIPGRWERRDEGRFARVPGHWERRDDRGWRG